MGDVMVSKRLLDAKRTTGDGDELRHDGAPFQVGSFQWEITGSPTRAKVDIKALVDGSTYSTILTIDTNNGDATGDIFKLDPFLLARQLKATVVALTGGNQPTVSLYFLGGV